MNNNELTEKIEKLKQEIKNSDYILIGAGAGLSTSAGFLYDGKRFEDNFKDYIKKYGFTDMYSAGFYNFPTLEEYWAYFSLYVYIADTKYKTIENVEYETDIKLYDNTIYQKHYNFIRNAFWFYILSATIYSSPVLTKLLENRKITENDIEKLEGQKLLYKEQIILLENNKI